MTDYAKEKKFHILDGTSGDSAGHQRDHEDHDAPSPERESHLNLAALREKLRGKSGTQYWRTLEELAADPHFEELIHREFPRHASEWDESVDRREFLKLMGASLALAGLAGCGRPDETHIVPYVKQPDGLVLGHPSVVMPSAFSLKATKAVPPKLKVIPIILRVLARQTLSLRLPS